MGGDAHGKTKNTQRISAEIFIDIYLTTNLSVFLYENNRVLHHFCLDFLETKQKTTGKGHFNVIFSVGKNKKKQHESCSLEISWQGRPMSLMYIWITTAPQSSLKLYPSVLI